jgi:hypothetical protein
MRPNKITDKEYLSRKLYSKEMTLDELKTQHRISVAVFDKEKQMLEDDISSIKRQLENSNEVDEMNKKGND